MTYYHNNRCKKSREGLELLHNQGHNPEIVEYMRAPITPEELREVLKKLDMPAQDLVRKNEDIWKKKFKAKDLSEEELILAMVENPKLIQRPILVSNGKAVVGRPPERLLEIV